MDVKKTNALIAASVAGILAVAAPAMISSAFAQDAAAAPKVPCYGTNACKGTGECGGKGHSCAGKNACKGEGMSFTATAEDCLKMEGGRLTAEKE